jgi:uncharacterized membrane protein YeiH
MNFFDVIDILGTLSFAVSGTSNAMKKQLDVFGILIIAFVTSIGGGTLRDILLGSTPVAWLSNYTAIYVILIGCICTIFFERTLNRLNYTLFIFDSLGLGLFTLTGIHKASEFGLSPGICIALGTITGSFGGVIRDILLNEIPLVFRKEIYASASILGGILYFLLVYFGLNELSSQIIAILFIFIFRIIVVKFNLSLPSIYKDAEGRT